MTQKKNGVASNESTLETIQKNLSHLHVWTSEFCISIPPTMLVMNTPLFI